MIQRKNIRQAQIELIIKLSSSKKLLESSKTLLERASKSDEGRTTFRKESVCSRVIL